VTVELIPVEGLPEVRPGDDLPTLLEPALREIGVREGDVLAVTQKVVSKAEGRLAAVADRDAVLAAETVRVVARRGDLLIAETRHGLVCANAGVDASNVEDGVLSLLPEDPDGSAARMRSALVASLGVDLAVLVTDTFGRPWREGVVNVAIGCAGMPALQDLRGRPDHGGRAMETTVVALADEVAAATGLVMTKSAGIPAAIVRGILRSGGDGVAQDLVRRPFDDLFRESPLQALRTRADALAFGPDPVPRVVIEEAVRAALDAASAPLVFVAVDSAAAHRRLAAAHGVRPDAAVTIVPFATDGPSAPLDVGRSVQTLMAALHAQGVGSSWAPLAPEDTDGVRGALEMAGAWTPVGMLAVGWTAEGGAAPPRPPVDLDVVLRWR
jgi:coenzyme F420-0:L-glutamate ligase / coenzyme F420-1:gamma-L-glutamate ligase